MYPQKGVRFDHGYRSFLDYLGKELESWKEWVLEIEDDEEDEKDSLRQSASHKIYRIMHATAVLMLGPKKDLDDSTKSYWITQLTTQYQKLSAMPITDSVSRDIQRLNSLLMYRHSIEELRRGRELKGKKRFYDDEED